MCGHNLSETPQPLPSPLRNKNILLDFYKLLQQHHYPLSLSHYGWPQTQIGEQQTIQKARLGYNVIAVPPTHPPHSSLPQAAVPSHLASHLVVLRDPPLPHCFCTFSTPSLLPCTHSSLHFPPSARLRLLIYSVFSENLLPSMQERYNGEREIHFRYCNIGEKTTTHKIIMKGPSWCGSVDSVPACEPEGRRFDSQSGHMPGLWAGSPVGGT